MVKIKKLLILLLFFVSASIGTAGQDYQFGEGLRKLGYLDLASQHFSAMAKNSSLSKEEITKGRLGLGSIYEAMSKKERDKAKKKELLQKASKAYSAFLATADKNDSQYAEIQFKLSRLQKDEAQAMIDEARELEKKHGDIKQIKSLRKKAQHIYVQIVNNLPKSLEKILDKITALEENEKLNKKQKAEFQKLQIKKFYSKLNLLWSYYYLSDLVSTPVRIDGDRYNKRRLTEELVSKAEEFQFEYEGSPVECWGLLFGALGNLDLKNLDKAEELFNSLVDVDITPYTENVINQGYYLFAEKQKNLKDLDGAIKTCQKYIDDFQSWSSNAAGIRIAFFYSELLVQTKKTENIKKALDILQVIAKGKLGAGAARNSIADILKANQDLGKSMDLLMSEGAGYRLKNNYAAALASFEEAFIVATPKERRLNSKELFDNLGACYYQLKRKREAAIIFEYLFDTYPKDDRALKWIGYAKAFFGQTFSETKSSSDKAQYARAVEKEMGAKPEDELSGDPNYKLATIAESDKRYADAVEKYSKVSKDSPYYLKSQFKVIEQAWKIIQKTRSKKGKKFKWKQYESQCQKALKGFSDYIKLINTKLSTTPSKKQAELQSYKAQCYLNRGDVYQTMGNNKAAVKDYNIYLNDAKYFPAGKLKALLALMIINHKSKNHYALYKNLKLLKKIKPNHKYIPLFQGIVAEAFRKEYLKAKKAGDEAKAKAAAIKAADSYWSLLESGKKLHKNYKTHIALVEVLGDMFLHQVGDYDKAITCYKKVLDLLGPFGTLDEKRIMYPITDRRLNKGMETKNYKKFADYLIDKSDFSAPANKWTEEPINYGLALKIGYTRKGNKYVPGGKFKKKNDKNKKMFEVLAELEPEISKRQHIMTLKEKLAGAYASAKYWDKALAVLVELDKYYKIDPVTKKALADLYKENKDWEKAIELYHTLRGSYKPNTKEWFNATADLAICMEATGDVARIKEGYKILQFVIINAGSSTPDSIKKLAAQLAAKVKE